MELPDGWKVRTQKQWRGSRAARWAYVIEEPGFFPFVSRHIFHSEEAAEKAGLEDALLAAQFEQLAKSRRV